MYLFSPSIQYLSNLHSHNVSLLYNINNAQIKEKITRFKETTTPACDNDINKIIFSSTAQYNNHFLQFRAVHL